MDSRTDVSALLRLMSASTLRAKVLAGNVANQNVPGFKRRDVEFESMLQKAMVRQDDFTRVTPQVTVDTESPSRPDGNNVVIEDEVSAMQENRLLFELYAGILSSRMRTMNIAINGDR
ncbi:MAG: flagellar basal-body rod protein FlgB [Chlamydiales bacterium]|jgi:flagellar basal-body rod protein FlgB